MTAVKKGCVCVGGGRARQELSRGGACEVVFFFFSLESNDKEITEERLILNMIVGLGRGLSW